MLSIIEKREALAQRVIDGHNVICAKLKDFEQDIRALWTAFDELPQGITIRGCRNKKEFCKKHLGRTPRAIQHMLAGRPSQGRHEQSSRHPNDDVFDSAFQYLSSFSSEGNVGRVPALLDHLSAGHVLSDEQAKTLAAVINQLEHVSKQAAAYREKLSPHLVMKVAA